MPAQNLQSPNSELATAFSENQHDIYALNAMEMVELWASEQKSKNKNQQQVATSFEELIGHPISLWLRENGKTYSGAIVAASLDAKVLGSLAIEMQRSGSILGRYYIQVQGGKQYVVFKGRAGLRQVLTGTRYLATNTKVLKMGIGGKALSASAKGGMLVSVIFSVALNTIDWIFTDEFRWTDWLATISTDLVKAFVAGVAGYLVGAGIAALATGSMIAVLPLAAAVFVAIGVAFVLNEIDTKYGITRALIERLEHVESEIKQDAIDGIYYLFLATGRVVRRRLISSTKQYINRLIKRFIQFPALR